MERWYSLFDRLTFHNPYFILILAYLFVFCPENEKTNFALVDKSSFFHGWAGWIRTSGMTESKSVALPLGDSPISKCILAKIGLPYSGKYEKKAKSLFLLYGVDSRIRTDGLQSHNLAL